MAVRRSAGVRLRAKMNAALRATGWWARSSMSTSWRLLAVGGPAVDVEGDQLGALGAANPAGEHKTGLSQRARLSVWHDPVRSGSAAVFLGPSGGQHEQR